MQQLRVVGVAEGFGGMAWNTANEAVQAEGQRVLIDDGHRFDAVAVVGVDGTCGAPCRGDKYVTVIIDVTPIRALQMSRDMPCRCPASAHCPRYEFQAWNLRIPSL